jgi:hypothetical protein
MDQYGFSEDDLFKMTTEQIEMELLRRENDKNATTVDDVLINSVAHKLGRWVWDETQKRNVYTPGTITNVVEMLKKRGYMVTEQTERKKIAEILMRSGI